MKENQVDIIDVAREVWTKRRTVIYSVVVAIFLGLLIAIFSPEKFESRAVILPQTEEKADLGNLGGLASLAGMNLGSMMGTSSGIRTKLFPMIIDSYPFLNEMVHTSFDYEEEKEPVSFYEKEMRESNPGVLSLIKKYTIRLPWTIKNAISGKDSITINLGTNPAFDVIVLTEDEVELFETARDMIEVDIEIETGLVTISCSLEERVLAAQVTRRTVELLQNYIIEYKTQQARQELEFIKERLEEKRAEFEKNREAFFQYRDRNRNVLIERTDIKYQELNDSYNIAMGAYQNLAQQREQAEITVKKETPAFSIIEPAKVPVKRSSPRRGAIMIVTTFLGGIVGIGIVLMKMRLRGFKKAWKEKEE